MLGCSVVILVFSVPWAAPGTTIFYHGRGVHISSVNGRKATIADEFVIRMLVAGPLAVLTNAVALRYSYSPIQECEHGLFLG